MSLPRHIGIIMDGNGRWAQVRKKPRTYGHIKGARVAKKVITSCAELGIQYLTLYAFSTENWFRPEQEVSFLMKLLRHYLKKETHNLVRQNIRFSTIGEIHRLPVDVIKAIDYTCKSTEKNTGLNLVFAISYGSRSEITETVKRLAGKVANGELEVSSIDEAFINSQLSTFPAPDPDLIIRTSGENRLSNFLLWQTAYSELYFTNTLWPDFSSEDLQLALRNFSKRERRYGSLDINARTFN